MAGRPARGLAGGDVAARGRQARRRELVRKFDPLLTPEGSKNISPDAHVDYRVFGAVPLEIYLQTKDPKFLELGRSFADKQWATTTPDGITSEARYWIDDMYMITAVQVQACRATGDAKYLDRAALAMVAYLDRLHGWLDAKTYGPAARRAWLGLVKLIDERGNVREVCAGTNKGYSVEYYLYRPRNVGDLHGQAPILWSASALLR